MNLKEAKELLKKNGYKLSINEDKYMDDMDTELEELQDLAELKKYAPSNIKINGQNFKFDYDDRYTITGKTWYRDKDSHGFMFKLFDNKLNKKVTDKYNYSGNDEFTFYIFENRDNYVNFGPVNKFIDTTIPFEIKEWENMNKPGFFKKLFNPEYNESTEVNEDYNFYRNRFHQMAEKRKKAAQEKKATGLAEDGYQDDLEEVVSIINKKHEVIGTKEVPAEEGYKDYKIVTKDNKVYTLEFKNKMFEYRGNLYPWRLTLSTSKFGFVVIGYSLNQLKNYFNKVK